MTEKNEERKSKLKKIIIIGAGVMISCGIAYVAIKRPDLVKRLAKPFRKVGKTSATAATVPVEDSASVGIDALQKLSMKSIRSYENTAPFTVKSHTRLLPEGWHASESAIENAKLMGIELPVDRTFVLQHTKCQQYLH